MEPTRQDPGKQRAMTVVTGAMALIATLLLVQMWLLSAALDAYLAGHEETARPAAVISGLIFLSCLALYVFVARIDAETRQR